MNILLVGSGGREHALAIALRKSPLLKTLFAAPGNPGIGEIATLAAIDIADHAAVVAFCHVMHVDFVVIGPEGPLVAGLVDDLAKAGIPAFGPSKAAAQLEGSKGYTKDLCREFDIPTAAYARFQSEKPALAYVKARGAPIVVKADGLAAGKGVVVAQTEAGALAAVKALFANGEGAEVVIEAMLEGEEASFFALCDGTRALAFGAAQDHKRAGEGDTGPNTGGMGAYSPAPVVDGAMAARIMATIIQPTLDAMRARGTPFKGLLFAGLMIGRDGPQLIEYNTRFGDPETQVVLPRLQDDLLPLLLASARGDLPRTPVRFSRDAALTVVLAAKGYPGAPQKGGVIRGVEKAARLPGVAVTHAGTARSGGELTAAGGRVLNITALAPTLQDAAASAYAAVDALDFPSGFYRRDIGWRVLGNPSNRRGFQPPEWL